MKAKRIIALILFCILLIIQFNFVFFHNISFATDIDNRYEITEKSNYSNLKYIVEQSIVRDVASNFETEIISDREVAKQGEEIEVIAKIKNLEKEIYAIGGKLEYDKNTLELIENEVTGVDPWKFSINDYNLENFKFVTDSGIAVSESSDIIKLKFRVKEDAEIGTTTLSLKDVTAGTGEVTNGILYSEDSIITIEIKEKEEEPPVEKYFRSDVYDVNKESGEISRISTKTTVSKFKNNVETNMELTFTDLEGNVLQEDAFIGTGMKLKLEDETEFVLIVTADINGDGIVGIDDIAKLKLHYIEREFLTGIQLKAADVDVDSKITINDLAQMKLIYIEKV